MIIINIKNVKKYLDNIMNNNQESKEKRKTNSITRTLRILYSICKSKQGVTISEIAKEFNISVPLMHNYIKNLKEEKYIFKDSISGRFRATFKIVKLGSLVLNNNEIAEISYSTLSLLSEDLKSIVHLAVKEGDLGVCVSKVGNSEAVVPSIMRVGINFDLYATALGKAILAFLDKEEIDSYLARVELISYTQNTITEPHILLDELKLIRERKYSIDNEEHRLGLRALGVPIFDYKNKPIGSISILLHYGTNEQEILELFKVMYKATEKISVQLGSSKFKH